MGADGGYGPWPFPNVTPPLSNEGPDRSGAARSGLTGVLSECLAGDRVRGWQWLALSVAVGGFLWLHFFLAGHLIAQTNADLKTTDQTSYLRMAWESRNDALPMRTDAVRNSLWQWLVVHTWLDGRMDDMDWPPARERLEPHFVAGKWFNVWLTAAFLAVFPFVCARFFPLAATLNLLALAGIGVLLPRAVFFQPEALYFMLFFACWLCGWRLLLRNPLWLYAALGVLTGVAYLAKPSTAPLLAVFVIASTIRLVAAFRPRWLGFGEKDAGVWSWRRHLAGLALLALCHGVLILPRAMYAQQVYRDPFISMPGYWMWMDDWKREAVPFTIEVNYGKDIHTRSKADLPSFGKWIAAHGWGAFWRRLGDGTDAKLHSFFAPNKRFINWKTPERWDARLLNNRGVYLCLPLALLAGLAVARIRRGSAREEWGAGVIGALFGLGAFSIYTLAYGWYDPIGRGDRFMMTLYLPVLFMLMWGCERLKRRMGTPAASVVYAAVQLLMLAGIATHAVRLVSRPAFTG